MKSCIFISFFILSLFSFSTNKDFVDLHFISTDAEYNIITYKNEIKNYDDFEFVENGETLILKSNKKQSKILKNKIKTKIGEWFCVRGSFEDFKKLVLNFEFVQYKEDLFNGIVCVYGFSRVFYSNEYIVLDNTKYNTQITFDNGVITIGHPIIIGSY